MMNLKIAITFLLLFSVSFFKAQFVENKGQVVDEKGNIRPDVLFTLETSQSRLFFQKEKIIFALHQFSTVETEKSKRLLKNGDIEGAKMASMALTTQRIDLEFLNANKNPEIIFEHKKKDYENFYLAHCPKGITNVPVFEKVTYKNVYPNIDIVFKTINGNVKYDIVLHKGANLSDVKFQYNGASSLKMEGNLLIAETNLFPLIENMPFSFWEDSKELAEVKYQIFNKNTFGFVIDNDQEINKTLIIDPVLSWATLLERSTGGSASSSRANVCIDANGDFFYQISTYSADMPLIDPGGGAYFDPSYNPPSGLDIYFAKFDVNRTLIWSTYLGGGDATSNYYDHGIRTSGSFFYIVGDTEANDFPTLDQGGGAFYQTSPGGAGDKGFLSKFNKSTGVMVHSTYLLNYSGVGVDVDAAGNVAVSAQVSATTTPVVMARGGAYNQAANAGNNDIFLYMFNSSMVQTWGTYMGGSDFEDAMGIKFDNSGSLYLFNRTTSADAPFVDPGGGAYFDNTYSDKYDYWMVKFNTSGAMTWSTLYGGAGLEGLSYSQVEVNANNEMIFTSTTRSTVMSLQNPGGGAYYQTMPVGLLDGWGGTGVSSGFIMRFNSAGVLLHGTYMGRDNEEVYIQGQSQGPCDRHYLLVQSRTFPTTPLAGSYNVNNAIPAEYGYLAMEMNSNWGINWSSYVHSDSCFMERMVADVNNGRLYITGRTRAKDFPTVDPGGGAYYDGIWNAGATFAWTIMDFDISSAPVITPVGSDTICAGNSITLNAAGGGTINWWDASVGGTLLYTGAGYTFSPGATVTVYAESVIGGCTSPRTPQEVVVNPVLPQPGVITGPAAICASTATGYSISVVSGAVSYTWSYTGTGTITGSGTSISLNATTGGDLSVTATNSCGTSAARILTISVSPAIPATPGVVTGPSAICASTATGYSIVAVPNATSYTWNYTGTGMITGTGTSISLNATTGGSLSVTASNACGTSAANAIVITIDATTPATPGAITGASAICTSTATGYSIVAVANATSYTWNYTGTGTITGSGTSISLNATTGGSLSVTASNACGTSAASTLVIAVDIATPTTPGAITGASAICTSTAAGYSIAAVANATSYTWNYTGTGTITGSGTSISLNATTGGSLSVTASNACGTSAANAIVITIDAATPVTPGAITGASAICTSTATGYSIGAVASATSYTWNYTGTGTITGSGTSISLNATTGGSLSVTATNACGTSAASTLVVSVDAATPATPGAITGASAICTSTAAGYSTAAVANATSYTWSYTGTGTITGSGTSISLNATTGGSLSVTASNACGTSAANAIVITIDAATPATPGVITGAATICASTATGYSITAVANATSYTWNYTGTGTITGSGTSISLNATTGGSLSVTASNACGISAASILVVSVDAGIPAQPGVIGGLNPICRGAAPVYSIGAVVGASSYTWSYSGAGTATSSITSVTFSPTTNGILSVTATNTCGTSIAQTFAIMVDTVFATNVVSSGTDICISDSRSLVGSPLGGTWSITAGGGFASLAGNILTGTSVGTVQLRYRITNACGNMDVTQNINIVAPAVATVTSSIADMCINDLRELTGTPVGGNWTILSGPGFIGINDTLTANASGVVEVSYNYSSPCGLTSDTVNITVNPDPVVTVTSSLVEICIGGTRTLTGTPAGGSWAVLSGPGSLAGNVLTTSAAGSIQIEYTASQLGCTASTQETITVLGSSDATWVSPGTVCEDTAVIDLNDYLSGTATTGGTWSGHASIGAGGVFNPSGLGSTAINVKYKVGTAPCEDSLTLVITVNPTPVVTITSSGADLCLGSIRALTGTPVGGTWTVVSGPGLLAGNVLTASAVGNLQIEYTVIQGGCSASSLQTLLSVDTSDATWTSPGTLCENSGLVNLYTYLSGTATLGGTWSGHTNILGGILDPTGLAGTTINVKYKVGTSSCADSLVLPLTIAATPNASWTMSTTMCESKTYDLDTLLLAGATTGGTWSGPGVIGSLFDPYGLTAPVTLKYVTTIGTCSDSMSITLTNILTAPTVATVTLSADTVCDGNPVVITGSGSGTNLVYNVWDSPTGGTFLGQTPLQISPTATTTYYVEAAGANLCPSVGGRTSATVTVDILVPVNLGGDIAVCLGDAVSLSVPNDPTHTYLWSDGTTVSSFTSNPTATTVVWVRVTNPLGCTTTDTITCTVNGLFPIMTSDDSVVVISGKPDTIDAQFNDAQLGNINIIGVPTNGVAYVDNDEIVYQSNSGYVGEEIIQYEVCDTNCALMCDSAFIIIMIEHNVFDDPDNGNIGSWGVTPNGDGINDVLHIDGLFEYPDNEITIYNRWGDEIHHAKPYGDDWNGKDPDFLVDGTYFFILEINGMPEPFKGFIHLQK